MNKKFVLGDDVLFRSWKFTQTENCGIRNLLERGFIMQCFPSAVGKV